VGTAIRHKAWFSVTARMDKKITAAISAIDEASWTAIKYPQAIWENDDHAPGGGYWISDAEVAEVDYVAFTGRRKAEHVPCRLIVRRVRRLQRQSEHGEQGELFAAYRHHAFVTNSTLALVEADERHRDHAVVEQVIAELKDGPLAHLPSGKYAANAAWVAFAVIAFNLARAAAAAAGMRTARWATLRRRIIDVPARIASTSRRLHLHLPTHWPWSQAWNLLWDNATSSTSVRPATGPPSPAVS
ncbi:MAG: transposase, partial [Kineosporiaceae bacterium]|nr:transposase [Kineosporiaceae bacterium]